MIKLRLRRETTFSSGYEDIVHVSFSDGQTSFWIIRLYKRAEFMNQPSLKLGIEVE